MEEVEAEAEDAIVQYHPNTTMNEDVRAPARGSGGSRGPSADRVRLPEKGGIIRIDPYKTLD